MKNNNTNLCKKKLITNSLRTERTVKSDDFVSTTCWDDLVINIVQAVNSLDILMYTVVAVTKVKTLHIVLGKAIKHLHLELHYKSVIKIVRLLQNKQKPVYSLIFKKYCSVKVWKYSLIWVMGANSLLIVHFGHLNNDSYFNFINHGSENNKQENSKNQRKKDIV